MTINPETKLPFQSTHPVRGATQFSRRQQTRILISIHAPREGCDDIFASPSNMMEKFQSTHPVRGATTRSRERKTKIRFQSTHPVRGATDVEYCIETAHDWISIHAPREGCDGTLSISQLSHLSFQSTHPVRGATMLTRDQIYNAFDFNPRTP